MNDKNNKPGFWSIVASTFAAAFGVQSKKNLEKDFKHGNIFVFIVAGTLFTILFILAVILVVRVVLSSI